MMYPGYVQINKVHAVVPFRADWIEKVVDLVLSSPFAAEDDWKSREGVLSLINLLVVSPGAMCYMGACRNEFGGFFFLNPIRSGHSAHMHGYTFPRMISHARAGIRFMMHEAFNLWKVQRLEAELPPVHSALIRIMEGLGFQIEGTRRKAMVYDGVWHDTINLAMLREEYRPEEVLSYGRRARYSERTPADSEDSDLGREPLGVGRRRAALRELRLV